MVTLEKIPLPHVSFGDTFANPLPLEQWFSTFLSSRHTNFVKKFGGTPKCNKRTKNINNNDIFCVLCQIFTIWRHTQMNLTAHLCIAAHRLRNTALECFLQFEGLDFIVFLLYLYCQTYMNSIAAGLKMSQLIKVN